MAINWIVNMIFEDNWEIFLKVSAEIFFQSTEDISET